MSTDFLIVMAVVSAVIGLAIGSRKGRPVAGVVLGALLGLVGVLIVAVLKPVTASPPAPPKWWTDPTGRHQLRYHDGTSWTPHVTDAGVQSVDPV